ncbi:MAG: sugar transferase [Phycisphaerae bacterium]|nr:sugar transferase [Phycisphaerae bacterium]
MSRCPSPRYAVAKLLVEWLLALVLLLLAAPVIAGLALLLKCTSAGPVCYSQIRLGLNGTPFRIFKLRTMTHGCEATTGPVWSCAPDPRITTVGRWLRDTHLDELPQFWNVLRGEMSLIGPRPERPELAATIERWLPEFHDRLAVRPGITGLAQVCLPSDSDLDTVRQKLAHDLQYIARRGLRIDFLILVATLLHLVGAAARVASRRLVLPIAPPLASEPPAVLESIGPSTSMRTLGHAQSIADPPPRTMAA